MFSRFDIVTAIFCSVAIFSVVLALLSSRVRFVLVALVCKSRLRASRFFMRLIRSASIRSLIEALSEGNTKDSDPDKVLLVLAIGAAISFA